MSHSTPARTTPKTPIERIFEKIFGRKMNAEERLCLHLGRKTKGQPKMSTHRHSRAA
jgi:hypothetical protein